MKTRTNGSIQAGLDGLFIGCFVYAFPIVLLHIYFRYIGLTDAMILMIIAAGFYGGAFSLTAVVIYSGSNWLFQTESYERNLTIALLTVQWPLWSILLLFDLSYEQIYFFRPQSAFGLALWTMGAVTFIGAATAMLSWAMTHAMCWVKRYSRRGFFGALALISLIAAIAAYTTPAAPECLAPNARLKEVTLHNIPGDNDTRPRPRVFWLGIDGADWDVLQKMIEEGRLPAFAKIQSGGAAGPLTTIPNTNSAVLWASKYTGLTPECHGIHDFYRIQIFGMNKGFYPVHRTLMIPIAGWLEKAGLALRLVNNRNDLRHATIWEIVHAHGLSIGLLSPFLYSYPLRISLEKPSWAVAYSASYEPARINENLEKFLSPASLIKMKETFLLPDVEWQSELLLKLIDNQPVPEFIHVYSHEPDITSHKYWHRYEPDLYFGNTPIEQSEDEVSALYERIDAFVGKLLDALPENTVLVISSDHGQAASALSTRTQSVHRFGPPGVLLLYGAPVKQGVTIKDANIMDVFPTTLYLLGNGIPANAAGRILSESLDPTFVTHNRVQLIYPAGENNVDEIDKNPIDQNFNENQLEALKALGYIGN